MPRNRSCGSYGPGHLMHWIQGKKSQQDQHLIIKVKRCARSSSNAPNDQGLRYYVLPKDDPVAALNILRRAAGLGPWPSDDAPVTK